MAWKFYEEEKNLPTRSADVTKQYAKIRALLVNIKKNTKFLRKEAFLGQLSAPLKRRLGLMREIKYHA